MFRFYFDNILVDSPINWREMKAQIIRDISERIVYIKMPQEMIWGGAGYNYIKSVFDNSGYCSSIAIKIEKQCIEGNGYSTLIEGIIFIRQCIFDNQKCTVELSITDNSYYAKININKNITLGLESI